MSYEQIRRLTITALFSDDILYDQLVLKGGNAMSLVHGISSRASLDLDFSLNGDFEDIPEAQARMQRALANRFAPSGFIPIDVVLQPKPSGQGDTHFPNWGGYRLEFKLVEESRHRLLLSNLEQLRREAAVIGPNQLKTFSVDLSKHEFTASSEVTEMDSYSICVYTPAMIAVEKLRAICQQMSQYAPTARTRRPRARDFYDIHAIATKTGFHFDTPAHHELLRAIFATKQVPLNLITLIPGQREFHRPDWPSVEATTTGPLQDFDFYFDYLLALTVPLHSLGMV
jgi:hypothetical protein